MTPSLLLAVYCVLIVAASLFGGRLPSLIELTHKRMQLLISFVGGLMLGMAIFHMLPHAIVHVGAAEIDRLMICLMLGLVVMFFLLRTFHFHHHEPEQLVGQDAAHHHDCGHEGHPHDHHPPALPADMSWLGVFVGLSLHTLIDGLALGASVQAEASHAGRFWMLGLGTFLAILLHKPLDALSITSLMRASRWSMKSQLFVNAAFAVMCPLGAVLFLFGIEFLQEQQALIVSSMLAFSAGVFLCISLSDLLPEMEFHSHNRVGLSLSLLFGIALAWCIRWIEPTSVHAPPARTNVSAERL